VAGSRKKTMLKRLDFMGKNVNFPKPTLARLYKKPLPKFPHGKKIRRKSINIYILYKRIVTKLHTVFSYIFGNRTQRKLAKNLGALGRDTIFSQDKNESINSNIASDVLKLFHRKSHIFQR
jgi:hypothetical protein